MKLYKLTQEDNTSYDSWLWLVVCASSPTDAKTILPYQWLFIEDWYIWNQSEYKTSKQYPNLRIRYNDERAIHIDNIKVKYIWEANKSTKRWIILEDFNAG